MWITGCGRFLVEFLRVGALELQHLARVFDHHHLQTQADAENRYAILARIADRRDLALDPAIAEAARNDNRVRMLEPFGHRTFFFQFFRIDVIDLARCASLAIAPCAIASCRLL